MWSLWFFWNKTGKTDSTSVLLSHKKIIIQATHTLSSHNNVSKTFNMCPKRWTSTVHDQVVYSHKSPSSSVQKKTCNQNQRVGGSEKATHESSSGMAVSFMASLRFEVTAANCESEFQGRVWSHRRWWCACPEPTPGEPEICTTPAGRSQRNLR